MRERVKRWGKIILCLPSCLPLSLDLSTSLPPEFCPLPFVCFLYGTDIKHLCVKQCQLEEFINCPFANHVEGKLKILLIR